MMRVSQRTRKGHHGQVGGRAPATFLFNTFCCSFYGSSTWGLHSNGFNLCVTAWNIGVRKILVHMKYKLHIRDLKF